MVQILKVIIREKRQSRDMRKKLPEKQQFTLLFFGSPEKGQLVSCWKEIVEGGKASKFGKVSVSQYKNGRIRVKKGNVFYFSDTNGIEGWYKEQHPEDRF